MKKFKNRGCRAFVAILIICSLVLGIGGHGITFTYAAEAVYAIGVVNVSTLNLRDKPDNYSNSKVLVSMPKGTEINITDQKQEGVKTWYYGTVVIGDQTYSGWCFGPYMTVTMLTLETDYANALREQGFPESYIPYLCGVHAKYSKWKFEPVFTNLDWDLVIQKESVHRENLVPLSSDDSRKSTSSDAYDFYTNTWHPEDTGVWVDAHPDYISYCMDPRNFLNAANIFMFESSTLSDSHTVEGVETLLKGTWMETEQVEEIALATGKDGYITEVGDVIGTVSFSQAIYDICVHFNLNPYQIAARLRQEQGVTKGPMMKGEYPGLEGYYNAFNFGASGNSDEEVKKAGLNFAKKRGWDTPYKAIFGGASRLVDNYISVGQDTLYFQKFHVYENGVTNPGELFWHQYMQNVNAPYSEGLNLAKGYTDKKQAFVFRIPVYNNMPDTAITFADKGNPNNYLSSLTVENLEFSPKFDGAKVKYTASVPYGTAEVVVAAKSVVNTSTVKGTGTIALNEGENKIVVSCTAKNGDVKKYTIVITREELSSEDIPEYSSEKYSLTTPIRGIDPGTKVADFLKTFTLKNCEASILNADGSENKDIITTGSRLVITCVGQEIAAYDLVVYGDVNGDGKINIIDLGMIDRYILKSYKLAGMNLEAADCNHDGKVNIIDLGMVDRQILKVYTISQ